MGLLNIVRTGDCAGYTWNIRWNQGGKKDTLTVILFKFFKILTIKMQKYLRLSKITNSSIEGNSPTIKTERQTSGGVLFTPILDNMLRTYHVVPQVCK